MHLCPHSISSLGKLLRQIRVTLTADKGRTVLLGSMGNCFGFFVAGFLSWASFRQAKKMELKARQNLPLSIPHCVVRTTGSVRSKEAKRLLGNTG